MGRGAFDGLDLALAPLASAVPAWHAVAPPERLRELAVAVAARDGRLAALWGSDERDRGGGFGLHLLLTIDGNALWLEAPLPAEAPVYPDLSEVFPAAARMQRAARDLVGIRSTAADQRPWLRHAAWPADRFPLRHDFTREGASVGGADNYPFVEVAGDGVHEIPVGPVHAGTIEPGHFRFSVVGEKVLRLEERLGYKHKGIERLFAGCDPLAGARLAGRISGDSTVAYAWAYAMALEAASRTAPPPRALWLRALALERERIANHLGDLGYLGNDGGLAFGLAQFMRLKEEWLRTNADAFGHRYLMDFVVPGGVARDLDRSACAALAIQCDALERETRVLKSIYDDHAGLQDRFLTCGRLDPELARKLGIDGLAARASGVMTDLRAAPAPAPYDQLRVSVQTHAGGDVAARVLVRFGEVFESLRLVRALLADLPPGHVTVPCTLPAERALGLGRVEGWRGAVTVALNTDAHRIRRCHARDPSWQNWPALEHAVIGNIVPDFPLINKSFNLSYSGHDL